MIETLRTPTPDGTVGQAVLTIKSGDTLIFFTDEATPEQLIVVKKGYQRRGLEVNVMLLPADGNVALLGPEALDRLYDAIGQLRRRVVVAPPGVVKP